MCCIEKLNRALQSLPIHKTHRWRPSCVPDHHYRQIRSFASLISGRNVL